MCKLKMHSCKHAQPLGEHVLTLCRQQVAVLLRGISSMWSYKTTGDGFGPENDPV